jgi:hypothetical protein
MFCATQILEKIKTETSSGFVNFPPAGTNQNPASAVCRCEERAAPWKHSCPGHPQCRREPSGATARKQIQLSFVLSGGAAWRERQGLRAARTACTCAVCGSSFSSDRRYKGFGIAWRPKRFGQNAAASTKDRRAFAGCRGQMTHAGLALMAVKARLGPA